VSEKIEDYYLTPWDMGYGSFIDTEHDFIGREALQKLSKGSHRKKVTLALEHDDVLRVIGSQIEKGERGKFMEFPSAVYSMHPYDRVVFDGKTAGISTWIGYSSNERRMLTIAVLEPEHAEPGTEVTLVWGEENGGTRKPTIERHKQMEIRAIVSPVPYAETARKVYADGKGWRGR
jgi:syringate O-demethylase